MAELNQVWVVWGYDIYDDRDWIEAITLSEKSANEIAAAKTKEYWGDTSYFEARQYKVTP